MLQITIASADIQKVPDALKKLVPTMDVTPLQEMLEGVISMSGEIKISVALNATDTLAIELNVTP